MTSKTPKISRIVRPGQPAPPELPESWTTAEERIKAVCDLSLLCMGWQGGEVPRLQRDVVRIVRPGHGEDR